MGLELAAQGFRFLEQERAPFFVEWIRQEMEGRYGSDILYRDGASIVFVVSDDRVGVRSVQAAPARRRPSSRRGTRRPRGASTRASTRASSPTSTP